MEIIFSVNVNTMFEQVKNQETREKYIKAIQHLKNKIAGDSETITTSLLIDTMKSQNISILYQKHLCIDIVLLFDN